MAYRSRPKEAYMRRILSSITLVLALVTLVARPATAHGTVVQYMSQHPMPRKLGGGFCYIDAPHYHDFAPSDPRMYRQIDGQYYFVGDPAPFDYQGPRHSFYGPHPVAEVGVQGGQPVYCYLQGPHYHWYQPPPQAQFELRGGAYWYTGTYEPGYYEQRPRYMVVNDAYAPIVYTRPVVDITLAPPGFHGEIVGGGPGWRGRAVVGAPVVSAGVYVAPPPPVQVGVGINIGGPPTVIERREYYEERHDNGRHRGWDKHGRHGHDDGWRGAPPPGGGGWRGNPPPNNSGGWRGNPPPNNGGWRGGPPPGRAPAPQGGWRGGPPPAAAPPAHPGGGGGGGWKGGGKPQQHGGGWKR
jgi:hypothetical protein